MTNKETYESGLKDLLSDPTINEKNRDLFRRIFERWEKKLKRTRKASKLDDKNYKTLVGMLPKFRNLTRWLGDKAWEEITEIEFRKWFNDFEDDKILQKNGKPYKDKRSYYTKICLALPFKVANKIEMAREVMEDEGYSATMENNAEVRFFDGKEYPKIVGTAIKIGHKTFLQVYWDVGENYSTILQLRKKNFRRQIDPETKQPEYLINLTDKTILKRSRTARTEPTIYAETVALLDEFLKDKNDEDLVFDFGNKMAEKIFARCVRLTNLKNNDGSIPTLKDIRSSMACHLLDLGWNTDEIKQRLGHKPSSTVLDRYVSYKALNRKTAKQKVYSSKIEELNSKLIEIESREKLYKERLDKLMSEIEEIKATS